jgi:hypothetical protein
MVLTQYFHLSIIKNTSEIILFSDFKFQNEEEMMRIFQGSKSL